MRAPRGSACAERVWCCYRPTRSEDPLYFTLGVFLEGAAGVVSSAPTPPALSGTMSPLHSELAAVEVSALCPLPLPRAAPLASLLSALSEPAPARPESFPPASAPPFAARSRGDDTLAASAFACFIATSTAGAAAAGGGPCGTTRKSDVSRFAASPPMAVGRGSGFAPATVMA